MRSRNESIRMAARRAVGASWLLLGCLLVTGCYQASELEAFLQTPRRPVSGLEYRIYPPDTITITSLKVTEINRISQQVRPDGKINLPLLGEIYVAGKTSGEVEKALVKAARKFYEEADATIQIARYRSQKFYVFGQVGRGGPMIWTGRDTLLDALAQAQPTFLAWKERIILVRGNPPRVGGDDQWKSSGTYHRTGVHREKEGQPRKTLLFNMMAMAEDGDFTNNVLLQPDDIIYVQPTPLARIGLTLQKLLFPFQPALQAARTPAQFATAGVTP